MTQLFLALALLQATLAADARADPPVASTADAASQRASELFALASEHYRAGRFGDAVALLLELQRIKPEPELHYNLARAYEGLGRWHDAITAYEAYLREDRAIADRGAIEKRLETLRRLEKPVAPPSPAPASRSYVVPLLVVGAGVAAAGTGVVFGVLSNDEEARAERVDQRTAKAALEHAGDEATAANIAFIAGGVLVATGLIWLFVSSSKGAHGPQNALPRLPTLRF